MAAAGPSNAPCIHYDYPAILVAVHYGGAGPGALATALTVLSAMWLLPPLGGAVVGRPGDPVSLGLFAAIGLFIVRLSHRSRAVAAAATAHARRLEAIVASAMDAVILLDASLRVVFFNPVAEWMFACPAAEAIG